MFASTELTEGRVYSRAELRELFHTQDATINTGIFQPAGYDSVWLFVTESKAPDRTQYIDRLDGDTLYWQGQMAGRKDQLIIEHERRGVELLLFYRENQHEHSGAGFRYEGRFRYTSHHSSQPTSFVLTRIATSDVRPHSAEETA